jgi:hypothetical protein
MCRMLLVHPSGFYAWLREPLSPRALEDQRPTVLLKQAWDDSGAVYGDRKLHDDLCDLGEDISPNRAWRLARLAGISAQIGYKKKPGSYGGSPVVVADIEPVNATGSREPARLEPGVRCRSPRPVLGRAIVRHWFENNGERHHLYPHA